MQRIFAAFVAILALVVCPLGCQNPQAQARAQRLKTLSPSARPLNSAGLSAAEMDRGAKLFVAKCARCHPLYDPNQYTDVEFWRWMARMSNKARLKPEQEDTLERYLGAFRALQ